MAPSRDPWRFVIVASCAATLFLGPSMNFANGVLLVALNDTGLYDVSTVAWLMSLSFMMFNLGGPLGSMLINFTSCRTAAVLSGVAGCVGFVIARCSTNVAVMFVFYGALTGLSRGIAASAATMSIGYWFEEESNIASGLMYVGIGVGMLVHPRLFRALVDLYGVQDALLLMGALTFHTCICGLLLRPSVYEVNRTRRRKEEQNIHKGLHTRKRFMGVCKEYKNDILMNFSFMYFVVGFGLFIMALQITITFMPAFFESNGSTPQEAAMAASITGSGSLISRVLLGIIASDPKIGPVLLFAGNCGISAVLSLLLPVMVESVFARNLFAFGIGTYLTSLFVIHGPIILEKVGLDHLSTGFGFSFFVNGVLALIGPPLAVQVEKATGSYSAVFISAGCLLLVSCVCGFMSDVVKKSDLGEEHKQSSIQQTITIESNASIEDNIDDELAQDNKTAAAAVVDGCWAEVIDEGDFLEYIRLEESSPLTVAQIEVSV